MNKKIGRVLMIDDNEELLIAARLLLQQYEIIVDTCNTPLNIANKLKQYQYDVILLDMNFSQGAIDAQEGLSLLKQIKTCCPDVVVLVITAYSDVNIAVATMKLGATDFIIKPWQNEKLLASVQAGITLHQSLKENERLQETNRLLVRTSNKNHQPMLGQSPQWKMVIAMLEKAAPTDANILILGENGTGKELVARDVHEKSTRAHNAFIAVDMGALSDELFLSELFGHKKGAFTGATQDRVGLFQAADGGTLFLDEIGNIPLHLQAKLLTALEQRKITPLGSSKSINIDVRIIAATNLAKEKLNNENHFRQDLYYRLNTVEILLPALRERPEDIKEIAQYYLNFFSRKYNLANKKIDDNAYHIMENYTWPGNIRSLKHAIERAVVMSENNIITMADLQLSPITQTADIQNKSTIDLASAHQTIETDVQKNTQTNRQTNNQEQLITSPENQSGINNIISNETNSETKKKTNIAHPLNLAENERLLIIQALQSCNYHITKTAKALGLTRAALYRRMEKYDL